MSQNDEISLRECEGLCLVGLKDDFVMGRSVLSLVFVSVGSCTCSASVPVTFLSSGLNSTRERV